MSFPNTQVVELQISSVHPSVQKLVPLNRVVSNTYHVHPQSLKEKKLQHMGGDPNWA